MSFTLDPPLDVKVPLRRVVDRYPFLPSDPALLDENCYEAFNIQVQGLMTRLAAIGSKKVVLGISGGLDSTHALIVAARAFDRLGYERKDILCFTLPGLATSKLTKTSAHALMRAFGVSAQEIDITPIVRQTLIEIGHPNAKGHPVYDVTFENVQAGARTALCSPREFPQCHRDGNRRSVGTGARLVHLWRRRSNVPLQRQRLGAQDLDPAPHPLGGGSRGIRARRPRDLACRPRHRDFA